MMAKRKISLLYSLFHGKFLRDIGNGDKTENFQISIILRLGYQKSLICKFLSISLFLFCFKPSLTLQLHFLHIFCIDSKLCTTTTAITIQWLNFLKCVSIESYTCSILCSQSTIILIDLVTWLLYTCWHVLFVFRAIQESSSITISSRTRKFSIRSQSEADELLKLITIHRRFSSIRSLQLSMGHKSPPQHFRIRRV